MTFLPIAGRELRVGARRHFTYWSRVVAAALIMVIFGMILAISMVNRVGMGWSPGLIAFNVLKWIAFLFACSAGIFLTSDSISEEKREGTLGLLFLTDLRGYDVVFGKLLSQSLVAFFCLLAAFPILALPLLMGGVTGTEFGRSMLIICNTLFLSLAVGMFVSSISREVLKAMNAALLFNVLIICGLPWADWGWGGWDANRFKPHVSIASPGYLFMDQSGLRPNEFWFDFFLQHSMAWLFLALSCFCAPRGWQEKTVSTKGRRQSLFGWFRFGSRRARLALRRRLLPKNPVLWIALRDRWMPRVISLIVVLSTVFIGWNLYAHWNSVGYNYSNSPIISLLVLALILWVASQACRMFVDAVRNGAMELILVTPLPPRQIIYGQWNALWRIFLVPVILILLLNASSEIESLRMMKRTFPTSGTYPQNFVRDMKIQQIVGLISGMVTLIGDFVAIAWFGMWMGLTSRKTSVAVLKTICFVIVLPWIAEIFVQIMSMSFIGYLRLGSKSGNWPMWISSILAGLFELGKNVFFVALARHKVFADMREIVADAGRSKVKRTAPLPEARVVASSSPTSP